MSAIIVDTVGIVVEGSVTRKYDATADQTTLNVDFKQAQELHDSLGTVLKFFAATQDGSSVPPIETFPGESPGR